MKKLLYSVASIAAMIIVSSCSDDSLDEVKNENATNKNQISQSAGATTAEDETPPPPPIIDDGSDDKDRTKI